jgi:signal transduction protein with GAF and PtsI domain
MVAHGIQNVIATAQHTYQEWMQNKSMQEGKRVNFRCFSDIPTVAIATAWCKAPFLTQTRDIGTNVDPTHGETLHKFITLFLLLYIAQQEIALQNGRQ